MRLVAAADERKGERDREMFAGWIDRPLRESPKAFDSVDRLPSVFLLVIPGTWLDLFEQRPYDVLIWTVYKTTEGRESGHAKPKNHRERNQEHQNDKNQVQATNYYYLLISKSGFINFLFKQNVN